MNATSRGRKQTWTQRSAFLGAVALLPMLGAVVPAEWVAGRITAAVAAVAGGIGLVWLFLLATYWARTQRSRDSVGQFRRSRPVLLVPGGILFASIATADAVALYHRGSLGFGMLVSLAAALFAASVVSACLAAFADA
jgi:disulfide bond formation protein DsbB